MILTGFAILAAWQWGLAPTQWSADGLSGAIPQADVIRSSFPRAMVQPEWIVGDRLDDATNTKPLEDLKYRWQATETLARMGVILLSWISIVAVVVAISRRRKIAETHNPQASPNSHFPPLNPEP
jgi:hypothetical protein